MGHKRTSAEAELAPVAIRRYSKRGRISSPSDSSEQSMASVSQASAMRSSPGVSESTTQSSPPRQGEFEDDSESTASPVSSGSSSLEDDEEDEDEDEQEGEEEVVTLGGPKKPQIDPKRLKEDAKRLRRKLQAFMPKMRQANSELAAKGVALSMEDVGEDEQHIEMSLGLGVLEEQRDTQAESESGEEEERGDEDVMQTLLGLAGKQNKYTVEEVKEGGT
ncbi:hypothetical protein DOTSEDRAFT_31803 [Dothistroma septosporum NZE10]|uniref:Uncharacterized protein n=1 Tax=Dothistroma septosporum (strain NZE10 / CBS 128990) TaxID=675120 RepID=N1PV52_DOTSN|nr:hypothetical protein DOTSEDRAFT_31803 [Dothistroma septosporum NZE10]